MNKLEGKVALVTGGSRGIGAAIVRRLAADGAAVAINYSQSAEKAETLAAEIRAAGGRAVALQGDVAEAGVAARLVEKTVAELGALDILVNNAGLFLGDDDADAIRRMLDVNVVAPILLTQAAAGVMRAGSVVLNVSSVVGRDPIPMAAYSASKGAVDSLTKSHARALAPQGIRVLAVAPGFTETEMSATGGPEFRAQAIAATALGRVGTPEDIADVIGALVSEDGRWITGEIIAVGGGIRL